MICFKHASTSKRHFKDKSACRLTKDKKNILHPQAKQHVIYNFVFHNI